MWIDRGASLVIDGGSSIIVGMNPKQFPWTFISSSMRSMSLDDFLDIFMNPPHWSPIYGTTSPFHRCRGRSLMIIQPP